MKSEEEEGIRDQGKGNREEGRGKRESAFDEFRAGEEESIPERSV